jgi:hypothetical protein
MELFIELQQLVKFFEPLVQRESGQPPHSDRVRKPVDGFTATKIKIPSAIAQTFISPTFAQLVVYHLPSHAVCLAGGFHDRLSLTTKPETLVTLSLFGESHK